MENGGRCQQANENKINKKVDWVKQNGFGEDGNLVKERMAYINKVTTKLVFYSEQNSYPNKTH